MADLEGRLDLLPDVGEPLLAEMGQEAALTSVLHHARELTGARYAAVGVLDQDRLGLQRFLTLGVDDATRRGIGELPHGRGILGVLIDGPSPLLIADIRTHPDYYGFPPGHPEMRSFLGVPIVINERAWGNLYLAEKRNGESFTERDMQTVTALAQWAASAIGSARTHDVRDGRYAQLDRGHCPLETSRDMTNLIGGTAEPECMLEFIVKRARDIIGAQGLLLMLREGDELLVAACAGLVQAARGTRLAVAGSLPGQALERGQPVLVTDMATELQIDPAELGVADGHVALLVPLLHREAGVGIFAAFDQDAGGFTDEDLGLLRAFAQSTAHAIATGTTERNPR